ncbi:hypothetical protein AXF42_Ash005622 [Apostasia shenzhenica]|uniref:Uncharacterized protein n=1 Tax=Apostasia shenzhenica TaxID=1088818 RepID=A0A2I0BBX3_9ASPA|nr:hypothetical protein AXF42_Ash005622 [Apostasia shenzhenica]
MIIFLHKNKKKSWKFSNIILPMHASSPVLFCLIVFNSNCFHLFVSFSKKTCYIYFYFYALNSAYCVIIREYTIIYMLVWI